MRLSFRWSGVRLVREILLLALASSMTLVSWAASDVPPAPPKPSLQGKRALILHSYYKGFRWTDDENSGIESILQPELGAGNLYVEYMDTKRFYQREYLDEFPEIYRRKYKYYQFDVILATDDNAFDFLRQYRDRLFPGTPVVFCGINYFKAEELKGHRLFTGVSEEADVKDTLDLALRLHPLTEHIFVINEMTETGQAIHDAVLKLTSLYADRADFRFLEDISMPDLQKTLKSLPANSVVFYSFFSHDKAGHFFEYDESARAITSASNAPVYGAWDFNLGYGVVGGKLMSGFSQGVTAGKMALRILGGADPDAIPVVRFSADPPNRYMFDYVALQRFQIRVQDLPKGSFILNMPESFLVRHWIASMLGGAAIVVLAGVNSLLFLNIRRRQSAERALREQHEHLEELVGQRSEALRESQLLLNKTFASLRDSLLIIDAETRMILDCNPATTKLFGYERDEVVGQSVRLLHIDDAAFDRFGDLIQTAVKEKGYLHLPAFRMKRKNGEIFDTQHSTMPLYGEDGELLSLVSVVRDITEQKRTEEKLDQYRRKLRALAAELAAVEARERRAIAAQLHENLGQLLATSKLKIASLRTAAPDSALEARIAEVQGLVEEALQQTRSLTYQLSPPILHQLGLEAALKWLGENMEKQYGFRVLFSRQGESGVLAEESSAFLFSAIRELLVNVAKHAGASEVAIRLRWLENSVEILVRDNGKGFRRGGVSGLPGSRAGAPESQDGFGLFNIQERVLDLGGRIWIRAEPLKGTAVKIHLPLDASGLVGAET